MLEWWIMLIIGAATMLVGYLIGVFKAYSAWQVCRELLEESEEKLIEARRLLKNSRDELERMRRELES